jgi:hypothetical protein
MRKEYRLIKNLALKALIISIILILGQNTILGQEFHGVNTQPAYTGGIKP